MIDIYMESREVNGQDCDFPKLITIGDSEYHFNEETGLNDFSVLKPFEGQELTLHQNGNHTVYIIESVVEDPRENGSKHSLNLQPKESEKDASNS
jgi:hypothetical protein